MATFLTDTFGGIAGTDLNARTGETGATWTRNSAVSTFAMVLTDDGRARSNAGTTGTPIYHASGTPASNEYDVTADVTPDTVAGFIAVIGRSLSTNVDFYYAGYSTAAGAWRLAKVAGGAQTVLGSFTQTLAADTTYAVKLEIRSGTKKLYVDGVERVSSTDDAVTQTGKAGLFADGQGTAPSNTVGWQVDNLLASDPVAAATYTGSAAVSLAALTAAASGTFTVPTYTGSGAPSLPALAAAATGAHTAPVYTGSAAPNLPALTAAGAGIFDEGVFTAAGAPALPLLAAAAAGTFAAPVYAGAAAPSLPAPTLAASGTFAAPVYAGAAAISVAALTAVGVGDFAGATFAGAGAGSLPALTAAGAGSWSERALALFSRAHNAIGVRL